MLPVSIAVFRRRLGAGSIVNGKGTVSRMSTHKKHSGNQDQRGHDHHGSHAHAKQKKIHHDWRFWVLIVAVVLMLLAMAMYVLSLDESLRPGAGGEPEIPAAAD
jgi:Ca2+/H+ antiporter